MINTIINFFKKHWFILFTLIIYIFLSITLINNKYSLWYDEIYTKDIVVNSWENSIKLMLGDGKPALYYLLSKITFEFVPYSDKMLRLLSVIFGIPAIIYFYRLIKHLGKNNLFINLATLIFSTNLFFISYSAEARMYTLLCSLGIMSIYYYINNYELNKNKFIVVTVLGLCVHYVYAFLISAILITEFISMCFKGKRFDVKELFIKFKVTIISTTIILIIGILQITNFPNFGVEWIGAVYLTDLSKTTSIFLVGIDSAEVGVPRKNILDKEIILFNQKVYLLNIIITAVFLLLSLKIFLEKNVENVNYKKLISIYVFCLFLANVISMIHPKLKFFMERYYPFLIIIPIIIILKSFDSSKKLHNLILIIICLFSVMYSSYMVITLKGNNYFRKVIYNDELNSYKNYFKVYEKLEIDGYK